MCHDGQDTRRAACPVHIVGPWLDSLSACAKPLEHITPTRARKELRRRLAKLGVPDALSYCLHDFRRGHARDMIDAGATLAQLLRAGEWSSPAFLAYLDLNQLEGDADTAAVIIDDSEGEV